MSQRSLTFFEFLAMACIIFIFVGTFAIYGNLTLKAARQQALQNELANIRMALEHYRILNGRLPEKLTDLINKELASRNSGSKIISRKYLEHSRVDKDGNLVDPFMHGYSFDFTDGRVWSQTKKYENW